MKGSKSLNQHLSCKLGAYVIVHFCFLSFYEFTKNKSKGACRNTRLGICTCFVMSLKYVMSILRQAQDDTLFYHFALYVMLISMIKPNHFYTWFGFLLQQISCG